MPNTPNLALPYPGLTAAPNVPADIQALALAIDPIGAAWTAWTPALTAVTTNPTLGTGGTATGSYIQIGKTVLGFGVITFGTAATAAGLGTYSVSLPVARGMSILSVHGRLKCAGLRTPVYGLANTSTTIFLRYSSAAVNGTEVDSSNTTPGAWTINDSLTYFFTYQAA